MIVCTSIQDTKTLKILVSTYIKLVLVYMSFVSIYIKTRPFFSEIRGSSSPLVRMSLSAGGPMKLMPIIKNAGSIEG